MTVMIQCLSLLSVLRNLATFSSKCTIVSNKKIRNHDKASVILSITSLIDKVRRSIGFFRHILAHTHYSQTLRAYY